MTTLWHELSTALALLLIVEGIFPFLSPEALRKILVAIHQMSDSQMRFVGLTSMLLGVVLLYVLKY